jgi:hypothetical protein
MLSRGRTALIVEDGRRVKVCACGARFPAEYNTRGQMTSRKLCDACRERRERRHPEDPSDLEGVSRCGECSALVGLRWGTVTHLDEEGRCPSCATWHAKRLVRDANERRGYRYVGGLLLRGPAPRSRSLRPRRYLG